MEELITTHKGRPTILTITNPLTRERTVVYVNVKDDYFLAKRREWRQKIASLHPDKKKGIGSSYKFRRAMLGYIAWRNAQIKEYSKLGLTPPGCKGVIVNTTPYRNSGLALEEGL